MLVDAIAHRQPSGATETTVLGPFYVPGTADLPMWAGIAPSIRTAATATATATTAASVNGDDLVDGREGTPAFVSGRVLDLDDRPVACAVLDVWQTDGEGLYDVQRADAATPYCRGKFTTGSDGRYGFRTARPVSYSIPTDGPVGELLRATSRSSMRPAHVHMIVTAPGFAPVTTHLFVAGDPHLDADAVFAVKQSLIIDFVSHPPGRAPDGEDCAVPFCTATFDFKMVRTRASP